ncbi:MAG: alpha/beta hydrolase-fold protein [Ferruginibacter sp.]
MIKTGTKGWRSVFCLYIFLVSCQPVFSQFKVTIQLNSIPATHPDDTVFVAGNFNSWSPGKNGYHFIKKDQQAVLQINGLDAGTYQFKFTRGSWDKVEAKTVGSDVENRTLTLSSDTVVDYAIAAWKDDFAPVLKQHTVSPNVKILDSAFAMPGLNRTRRISLYLPPGYATSKKRYPVLYMQDGQNIFDEYTAAFGEWAADECLDSMVKNGKPACIIVGIDNGPSRMTEYNPYEFRDFGKGEGDLYVDFIAKTLTHIAAKNRQIEQ